MRYIIYGAGSIGCLAGGLLADSGKEVVLVARPEQSEIINRNGIKIHSVVTQSRTVSKVTAVSSVRELKPRHNDILMLAVKSGQTALCCQELREVYGYEAPLLCLQNGVRNEPTAAERFLHVYGVMLTACVNYLGPGEISHTLHKDLVLGNYPLGYDKVASAIASDLRNAGFNVVLTPHIMAAKWAKLILNLSNSLLALTGHHLQLAWLHPEVSGLMADLQDEGLSVLRAARIDLLEGKNPIDVKGRIERARKIASSPPDEDAIKTARDLPELHRAYVSTFYDLKYRRGETEAGYLNGEIILLGQKHFIPTPINSLLFDLIERSAAQHVQPGSYSVRQIRELLSQPAPPES